MLMRPPLVERALLVAVPVTSCLFSLALLGVRIIWSGRKTYDFLAWNLDLALIPLCLALLIDATIRHRWRVPLPFLVFLWVVFLPNAPYVITDFVHLSYDPPIPLWFDVLLLTTFSWTGLLLGFLSIYLLKEHGTHRLGLAGTRVVIVGLLAATSVGIYLGRFEELNSWDLVVRPLAVLQEVASIRPLEKAVAVTTGFTLFLLSAYTIFEALLPLRGRRGTAGLP